MENINKDIHSVHNYIRDYTKISSEDKCFFIACILISLKTEYFISIINNFNSKDRIYDVIRQILLDFDIDISVFEFLRNDENNIHFYNIVKMIKNIYDTNTADDLLNRFYSEFVKYSNTDGKALGIVLTPQYIVEIMIRLLEIKSDDIFLDLCGGTGSFVLEALKYFPLGSYVCEYQNKLYNLLKCNYILRNIDFEKNHIIKGNCFDHSFTATKSAINPPYGMKDKTELDFILKQLESLEENGMLCAIIPISCLNSKSALKSRIYNSSKIKKIIVCDSKLFYPNANIKVAIVLCEKSRSRNKDNKTQIIDYTDDGYEIKRGLFRPL